MRALNAYSISAILLCSLFLASCDDSSSASDRNSPDHKIIPANGQTFYLNSKEGRLYVLRDQEFVELPTREPKAAPSEEAVKEISSNARDLEVTARLKFHDEKMLFFVDLNPQETEEYKAYESAELGRLIRKYTQQMAQKESDVAGENGRQATNAATEPLSEGDEPLVAPKERYLNKNWQKYWENRNNFVRAHLQDADEFPVASIDVLLSGGVLSRTQLVDDNEKAVGYSYYGEIPMSFPAFQRIERLRVTWSLEPSK